MSGTSRQGEVEVATVTFNAAPGIVDVGSPSEHGGVVVASLSVDGVLSYKPTLVGAVTLASGSVVKGIRQIDEDDTAVDTTLLGSNQQPMLQLRCEDGGTFVVVHDSGDVAEHHERVTTAYGVDTTIGADVFQLFCVDIEGQRRWRAPSWAGFFPEDTGRWSPVPATTNAAVNALAGRSPVRTTGMAAISSGVPSVVWSKTIAEGTSVGGLVRVAASFDNAGTIQHSLAVVDFMVSRSASDVPTLPDGPAPQLYGTIPLGIAAINVVGNDAQISLTYSATGTIAWTISDYTETLTP